jgi:ankyrin repeat protein
MQAVVSLLLSSGANPNAADNLGSSALLEAVKAGQARLLALLVEAGAGLQLSNSELASALCSMVVEGQEGLLRSYIAAGANVAAGDYDKRTPLHIAAAEGKLAMVRGAAAGCSVLPACVIEAACSCWCQSSQTVLFVRYYRQAPAVVFGFVCCLYLKGCSCSPAWP